MGKMFHNRPVHPDTVNQSININIKAEVTGNIVVVVVVAVAVANVQRKKEREGKSETTCIRNDRQWPCLSVLCESIQCIDLGSIIC